MTSINVCLAQEFSIWNLSCVFPLSIYFSVMVPNFCDIKFNEYPRTSRNPMAHIKRSQLKHSAVKSASVFLLEDPFQTAVDGKLSSNSDKKE